MKKEYINPELVIVTLASQPMLSPNSPTQSNGDYTSNGGITLGASEWFDDGESDDEDW